MGCWNQIAEAVLHEWELKKRLKKFKAKFRYIFTIFLSTLTQRIKYSLTEKWKNDFNRIWSEFGNSRIVIYFPESRIFSHKIEKSLKLYSSVMTFRKIPIYFDLREGGKNLFLEAIFYFIFFLMHNHTWFIVSIYWWLRLLKTLSWAWSIFHNKHKLSIK